jgi:hypothetical protein
LLSSWDRNAEIFSMNHSLFKTVKTAQIFSKNDREGIKMRGVGFSQNESVHFVLNPRKLAHNYRGIIVLRYRVLSPAPLTKLGNPRKVTSEYSKGDIFLYF